MARDLIFLRKRNNSIEIYYCYYRVPNRVLFTINQLYYDTTMYAYVASG
jgi:hypothetical protein